MDVVAAISSYAHPLTLVRLGNRGRLAHRLKASIKGSKDWTHPVILGRLGNQWRLENRREVSLVSGDG